MEERPEYAPFVSPETGEIVFPDEGENTDNTPDDEGPFYSEEDGIWFDADGDVVEPDEEDDPTPQPGDFVIVGGGPREILRVQRWSESS